MEQLLALSEALAHKSSDGREGPILELGEAGDRAGPGKCIWEKMDRGRGEDAVGTRHGSAHARREAANKFRGKQY